MDWLKINKITFGYGIIVQAIHPLVICNIYFHTYFWIILFHIILAFWLRVTFVTYPLSSNKTYVPFALAHTNIQGPARASTAFGYWWFVIFVDDFTRMMWLYFIKNKSDVYDQFHVFHKMVQTQFYTTLKVIFSDNGGEYGNQMLQAYFLGSLYYSQDNLSLNTTTE